jgi:hypothetical protein
MQISVYGQLRWLAPIAFLAVAAPAQADLLGKSFSAGYFTPDLATPYANASVPPDFLVGAGIEGSIDVEGVTDISFDFGALSLTTAFTTTLATPTWNSNSFNGIVFTSASPLNLSSAHVVSTTMAGFDDSRITISGNQIHLNWQGLSYVDGTVINIAFGAVPEPASWAMMIAGFAVIGGSMRRRVMEARLAYPDPR